MLLVFVGDDRRCTDYLFTINIMKLDAFNLPRGVVFPAPGITSNQVHVTGGK